MPEFGSRFVPAAPTATRARLAPLGPAPAICAQAGGSLSAAGAVPAGGAGVGEGRLHVREGGAGLWWGGQGLCRGWDLGCEKLVHFSYDAACMELYTERTSAGGGWYTAAASSPQRRSAARADVRARTMTGLHRWFAEELKAIGLDGLESVHDYLVTIPNDDDVREHLLGLLGDGEASRQVIDGYIVRRQRNDSGAGPSSAPRQTSDAPDGKKNQRGRGKAKSSAKQSGARSRAQQRADAQEIRRKIFSFRERRAALNCLSCGFIEVMVPEDGACSKCGAPMFAFDDKNYDAEVKEFEKLSVRDVSESGSLAEFGRGADSQLGGEDDNASFEYPERPYLNTTLPGGSKNMPKVRAEHLKQLNELVMAGSGQASSASAMISLQVKKLRSAVFLEE